MLAGSCSAPAGDDRTDGPAWRALFDGRTLEGWVESGGRYDGAARWTVEDGAITGRQGPGGEGGLLYTERSFANCAFACEVKIDHPFDSGIFLRMVPDEKGVQLTLDDRPDGEIGGVYSDGWLEHDDRAAALWRRGDWNRVRVQCSGRNMHLEAWLNGRQIVDFRLPPNSAGYAPAGRIGLQVHGGEAVPLAARVQFRDLRVRELSLPVEPEFVEDERGFLELTHRGLLAGWRPLVEPDGLAGWELVGDQQGVEVADGVLSWTGGDGYLRTLADYRDFDLRLDFRHGPLANSGIFLRGDRRGGDPASSGCEVQILDDRNWEEASGSKLAPWQFTGSLYGAVPPGVEGATAPVGEWNRCEIAFRGSRISTRLNDRLLYDVDTLELDATPPFADRVPDGFLGLQRHGAAVEGAKTYLCFRNLFVRRL